jgi:hypothetical protein
LSGIQQLSNLTSLALNSMDVSFDTYSTSSYATRLTGLQKLELCNCALEPEVLEDITQLQALALFHCKPPGYVTQLWRLQSETEAQLPFQEGVLAAVSKMALLTELHVSLSDTFPRRSQMHGHVPDPSAPVFTALTASTNLCSLQSHLAVPEHALRCGSEAILFTPGIVYPNLRQIKLHCKYGRGIPLGEQQVQQLCSCCPAVESLAFSL